MATFLQDDSRLHKLCQEGNLRKVRDFVNKVDDQKTLEEKLANRKGVFGYTPLHEAVANGHSKVLDFLLEKESEDMHVHVNCRANSGYTPLHLAASSGHAECVRVLLKHKADIGATDEYGKTPKQTAELSSKTSIVKLLLSEEIIKAVIMNQDNLTQLLRFRSEELEPDCLNRALKAATTNDSHGNVGKLIVKADNLNIKECLKIAKDEKKPYARAMLLLVKAAMDGNRPLVLKLFREPSPGLKDAQEYQDEGFQDVQTAIESGNISTVVPIEIARRNGHSAVREELLLRTDVNRDERTVYWHGLRLLVLDVSWLRKIHWVEKLRLARNGFKQLPDEMGTYLKRVVKLDLQHNELSTIPKCVLVLPSLQELNLSHNKLTKLPQVAEWSAGLTVLDLSYNQLQSMPPNATANSLRALNVSHNQFRQVPSCICSFTTLRSLDISENPDILILPPEMGRLQSLFRLKLEGLKDLNDPPRNVQKDTRDCIRYLNSKLRSAKGFYRMKLMLVGRANRGKTTLVAALHGREIARDQSTVGVDVSDWAYRSRVGRREFHFSIWDFGGQEEYYATHQCFLSQRSLYLLLFNLKDGESGVEELKPWLNNIALRAPRSCIVIVGTHLDEVADDEREEVDALLRKVQELAGSYYRKLEIVEVVPVGLKNRIENVGTLREIIYNAAANYKTRGGLPIMGQKIPASYHELNRQLEEIQKQVRRGECEPIMHTEEFKTMVQQMKLVDIHDEEELKTATLFLTDVGTLLHYDDRGHNLHELYFVDPRWLCDMMAKVVTIRESNPFVMKGLLYSKDIPSIFNNKKFPWQYFEQYLTLLDRFEIALPLDNKRILIPSMLPDSRPAKVDVEEWRGAPLCSRFIKFASADTPPGFWSRLLSRIMHSVPQVIFALDKITPEGLMDGSISLSLAHKSTTEENKQFSSSCSFNSPDSFSLSSPTPLSSSVGSVYTPNVSLLAFDMQPGAPKLLPFPKHHVSNISDTFDARQIQLEYWRTGLFYSDPDVLFRIESLTSAKSTEKTSKNGVVISSSPNHIGKKMISQLVDLVVSLINDWYPGLHESMGPSTSLEQIVPCYECIKMGRSAPYEFKVDRCLELISNNSTTTECKYEQESARNHIVFLADIVPDLLLQDIDAEFLLNAEDILYDEDESSLLGKGGYGKVFRGKYHNKPVAIKKYLTRNEGAFSELRSETKLLLKSHHPCLVCLVGVCIHPMMALVLEEAPMGCLQTALMKVRTPIHRVVIHRIAAQVAAALKFLHSRGIIFRDLKAANVLLWSLDPESLCHCKVTDFGIATYLAPIGAKGLTGTKGFIAPEVLYIGKRMKHSVYDHKADIFSFGMFLYQMISRKHPYEGIPVHRIDIAVEKGERPNLQNITQASAAFHYLTRIMQTCWEDDPRNRPSTEEIINNLCLTSLQSVMCVNSVRSKLSLRHACAITPADFRLAGEERESSEIWVVCDGADGAEINVYNTNTMVKISKNFIKENQVQCISLCGDHVWVGSRAGIEYGVIDIFNINTHELVHNIRMRENSVSCITYSEKAVYLGTLEGYCFAFSRDMKKIQRNVKPRYKYVSENAIEGIIVTQQCVWVSHSRYIFFLNPENLTFEGSISRHNTRSGFIGQLSLSPDFMTVWSVYVGGVTLSAWDAHRRENKFDIDVSHHLKNVAEIKSDQDAVITSMTPALDTVWVGMASGHILIFHNEELLVWYHAYTEDMYVRLLTCIPSSGPCEKEQCMVLSGAKGFQSPVPNMGKLNFDDYKKTNEKGEPVEQAGMLVLWEAFDAKMTRQVKLIEENAPDFFEDHDSVRTMIRHGDFKDGTHLQSKGPRGTDFPDTAFQNIYYSRQDTSSADSESLTESVRRSYDSTRECTYSFPQPPAISGQDTQDLDSVSEGGPTFQMKPRAHTATSTHEVFDIKLQDQKGVDVRVFCPKPAKLKVLLSELQMNTSLSEEQCKIEYRQSDSGECVKIKTQEQLEIYLKSENRSQLFVAKTAA